MKQFTKLQEVSQIDIITPPGLSCGLSLSSAPAATLPTLCIVATGSPLTVGGLAAYMRSLAEHLAPYYNITFVARFSRQGPRHVDYAAWEPAGTLNLNGLPIHIIAPNTRLCALLRRVHHLINRPKLQPLAIHLFKHAYAPALEVAIPPRIDVVHYIGTGWELLGFAVLETARRRKAALTMLPAVHPGTWGDSPLDLRLYNAADAVFALSNYEKQRLVACGMEPARVHVTGLAPVTSADGNGARFRERHHLKHRPLVLFIGRKSRGKGYHVLRQAMSRVLDDVPQACLVAIGPDCEPPYPPLPADTLLDLGQADEQTKSDALAACDVFCMPSDGESFGIVYVEAWAYGKPVVGGTAPAVREMISEGGNGYTTGQDAEQIASILTRLLSDPALRQRLGAAGQELQRTRYNWNDVTNFHKQVFEQVLAKSA